MEGNYNEDLCVFRARLFSQRKGAEIAASHFHFSFVLCRALLSAGGACLLGGGLITGLRVSGRAERL
jgi:hypothetical protein